MFSANQSMDETLLNAVINFSLQNAFPKTKLALCRTYRAAQKSFICKK